MKLFKQIVTALALAPMFVFSASAGESPAETPKGAQKAAQKDTLKGAPKELKNQTLCPVMGGKIDSSQYTDIQGQRVYYCCPMCSKKMKADPDKYFKKAAEEGVLFENIQTTCPVSGEKLEDKSIYTDYEGRRIYFCCENCQPTFEKSPQKYLEKMDQPEEPSKQSVHGDDSSHHQEENKH